MKKKEYLVEVQVTTTEFHEVVADNAQEALDITQEYLDDKNIMGDAVAVKLKKQRKQQ